MKIIVSNPGSKGIRLRIPTGLVLNRFTALLIPAATKKHGAALTYRQCAALVKELRRCKKKYKDWVLVEVSSADGEKVFVKM